MSSTEPGVPIGPTADSTVQDPVEGGTVIRSEERLSVSTRRVPAGIARLERFRVTETRTITVDLVREEVRLMIDRDAAGPGAPETAHPAGPDGPWLVLSEEQVVVSKQWVPVERVRLDVTPVTEIRDVTAAVRSERIELTHIPASGSTAD